MITISTRIEKFAEIAAIAERLRRRVLHGRRRIPITCIEEPETDLDRTRRARAPSKMRRHRRGRPRLSLRRRAARSRRIGFSAPISRPRARPACRWSSTAATPTPTWRRSLRDEMGKGPFKAVLHCFTSSLELAEAGLDARALDFLFRHCDVQEFARLCATSPAIVPLDRLLVETDAPFLAPVPHRGKRNEPAFVAATASVLAEVKGISAATLAAQTSANALRLFRNMPPPRAEVAAAAPHESRDHDPRLRVLRRRAARRAGLGRLRSEQSQKPPAALLDPSRADRRGRRQDAGSGRHLARSSRAIARPRT